MGLFNMQAQVLVINGYQTRIKSNQIKSFYKEPIAMFPDSILRPRFQRVIHISTGLHLGGYLVFRYTVVIYI